MPALRIGVTATSSVVPQVELGMGIAVLRAGGFDVKVHPICEREHFLFAGSDQERAEAFLECACSDELDVIVAARGGYGVTRMLPVIEEAIRRRGKPPAKLLVGYSDITALHHFVHTRWGWPTLHAQMPASTSFFEGDPAQREAMFNLIRGDASAADYSLSPIRIARGMFPGTIRGKLVGGNLSLWACTAGTPYQPSARDCIVFFEDIDEQIYRVDRMFTQVLQSKMLEGAKAIVLGDFTNCDDKVGEVLVRRDGPKKPLRESVEKSIALAEIFSRAGVPVFTGLPVGHGPNYWPLPLNAEYEITSDHKLQLLKWDWLRDHK